jgi:hypothetical protein
MTFSISKGLWNMFSILKAHRTISFVKIYLLSYGFTQLLFHYETPR